MSLENYLKEHKRQNGRKASCITTEQTDLLILYPNISNLLFQPDKKKKGLNQISSGNSPTNKKNLGDQMEAAEDHSHSQNKDKTCSSVSGDELS